MNTFNYSPLSKFLYRYAALPLTVILLAYFLVFASSVTEQPVLIIPAAICIVILYTANRFYYNTYGTLPFLIRVDKEKITASGFIIGKKKYEIYFADVDAVTGGVFGYNPKGLVYVHDGKQNVSITIHPSIENAEVLFRLILERINAELKEELITKLKQREKRK